MRLGKTIISGYLSQDKRERNVYGPKSTTGALLLKRILQLSNENEKHYFPMQEDL